MRIQELIKNPDDFFGEIKLHKNIILYGAGSKAGQTLALLESRQIFPCAICDRNEKLCGTMFLNKLPIYTYEEIKERFDEYCFILSVSIGNAVSIKTELLNKAEKASIYHVCNLFKVDSEFLSYEEVIKNEKKYIEVYNAWADELSKEIYIANLNSKLTGDAMELYEKMEGDSFFDKDLLKMDYSVPCEYVDVGAYTGDTICKFLEFSGGHYEKIIAIEADSGNFQALQNLVRYGKIRDVKLVYMGVWSKADIVEFNTLTDNASLNYDSPNFYQSIMWSADQGTLDQCKKQGLIPVTKKISVDTLNNILKDEKPTIIKINALAADYPILQGMQEILLKCQPDIIMEYGVRPPYLIDEIMFFLNLKLGYRFYLRQKNIFGDSKTILYATRSKV